jgi:hypothetical protein
MFPPGNRWPPSARGRCHERPCRRLLGEFQVDGKDCSAALGPGYSSGHFLLKPSTVAMSRASSVTMARSLCSVPPEFAVTEQAISFRRPAGQAGDEDGSEQFLGLLVLAVVAAYRAESPKAVRASLTPAR